MNNGNGRLDWVCDVATLHRIEERDIGPLVNEGIAIIKHFENPRPGQKAYCHRYKVIVGPGFVSLAPSVWVEFLYREGYGRLTIGRNEHQVRMLYARLCNGKNVR